MEHGKSFASKKLDHRAQRLWHYFDPSFRGFHVSQLSHGAVKIPGMCILTLKMFPCGLERLSVHLAYVNCLHHATLRLTISKAIAAKHSQDESGSSMTLLIFVYMSTFVTPWPPVLNHLPAAHLGLQLPIRPRVRDHRLPPILRVIWPEEALCCECSTLRGLLCHCGSG